MTDKQRTEVTRLWKSGMRSKEIGKKLRLSTMTVAAFAANMNRKNVTSKKTTKTPVVAIANANSLINSLSKKQIEETVALHNRTASAKHFINEIKGMKKSNPKVYNEVIKGIKAL